MCNSNQLVAANEIMRKMSTGHFLLHTLTDSLPTSLITCDRKASCNTENR